MLELVFSVICGQSVLNERSSKKTEQSTDAVQATKKRGVELNDLQMRLNNLLEVHNKKDHSSMNDPSILC
ncbi:hypothetical protein GCM10008022_22410 [Paenibacillus hunanensis]|nr:hypothetical protein GCM10008022_22410 [Paenibacillus hunanensis]